MKIKMIAKPLAAISAAAVLISASGCADTSWSFKNSSKELSNGVWIYKTYTVMNEAVSKYQEESGKTIQVTDDDFADKKVEKKKIFDWITDKAKDECVEILTIEKLVKDNKVKIDKESVESNQKMYENYMTQYGMDKLYEKLGVATKTAAYADTTIATYKDDLFKALYDKNGSKAVSDEEVKKYFTENYTDYYYINYSFKTTDSEGNSVDIDDATKDKVTAAFAKYAKELNEGKKVTKEIDEEYKTDFELGEDGNVPSVSNVANMADSNINEDVQKEIKSLGDKKATVKLIDDTYYLLYKGSISEKAEKISDDTSVEDAISRIDIVHKMKDDEFDKYIEAEKKKLKYDTNNDCLSKYTVERTVNLYKEFVNSNSEN